MKIRYYLLFAFVGFCSLLNAATWHVKQDGTGNFYTIQEGIIAATDNDTVLVYPGTYYENIDYLEKSITVASLYIITPEDSLINQTIVDGNQQFRCVTIDDCENASLIGFTIQNGLAVEYVLQGFMGGGVLIYNVQNAIISNCNIQNNISNGGGGLFIRYASVALSNNRIHDNWGIEVGGGLNIAGNNTNVEFDDNNLNSIYNNFSSACSEIYLNITNFVDIVVDTFMVQEPDYFFILSGNNHSFSCQNSKIEQIDQDLYISPNGNDSNTGITPDDPLQTIAWAQTLIKRNDENPHTIHLAPGIYSPSLNDQIYPLNVKHGVTYLGVSSEETILDAEFLTPFFHQFTKDQNDFSKLIMKNLKMINGECLNESYAGGINIYQADVNLTNVIVENCNGFSAGAIHTSNGFCNLSDVVIRNNNGWHALSLSIEYNCPNPVRDIIITNTIVKHNYPNTYDPDFPGGGGLKIAGHLNIPGDYNAKLINCEISENHNASYNPQTGLGGSAGLLMRNNISIDIVNCTFGDNTLAHSTGCVISVSGAELNMYNCILYNNDGYSFIIWNEEEVNISHSLIESGDSNVFYYGSGAVNWLEGNIDEDPLWQMSGDYPYMLSENSPCIDSGTLDLPTGIELPEFDLAGNPRIYGETIDMGAYEYQDSVLVQEDIIKPITQTKISNYPNPFNPSTTINLELAESGKIELVIYNIKGQKIKTLLDAYSSKGIFELVWRGTDNNGKKVASGNYFIKLKVNGEEKAVRKLILLK